MSNKNIKNAEISVKFPKANHKNMFVLASENHQSGKSITYYVGQYTDKPISYSGLANNSQSKTPKGYKDVKNIDVKDFSQKLNSRSTGDNIIRAIVSVIPEKQDEFLAQLADGALEIVDLHGYCHANASRRPYKVENGVITIWEKKLHKNPETNQFLCVIDADGRWLVVKNQHVLEKTEGYVNTSVKDLETPENPLTFTWIEESDLNAQIQAEHKYHLAKAEEETAEIGMLSVTEEQLAMNPFKA
jgi:hypothetical protein